MRVQEHIRQGSGATGRGQIVIKHVTVITKCLLKKSIFLSPRDREQDAFTEHCDLWSPVSWRVPYTLALNWALKLPLRSPVTTVEPLEKNSVLPKSPLQFHTPSHPSLWGLVLSSFGERSMSQHNPQVKWDHNLPPHPCLKRLILTLSGWMLGLLSLGLLFQ